MIFYLNVEDDGDDDKGDESDEVGPDVARLGVDAEDGAEALGEGGELRAVSEVEVLVVPHPGGQLLEVDGLPVGEARVDVLGQLLGVVRRRPRLRLGALY